MVDANANRAREALRVLEDLARFLLADEALCRELKELRHGLRNALDRCAEASGGGGCGGAAALMAWRDTPADVGTGVSTRAEGQRAGMRDVAAAAGKRLSEALRVLEECAKTLGPAAGAQDLEALRYRGYEAERQVLAALGTGRGVQWRLCVLLTERLCIHHSWRAVAEAAIAGGADCLQLREKELDGSELLTRARWLVAAARNAGERRPAVFINDRPDIAVLSGADGVHVGQDDLPVREIRRLAGDGLLVGVSTHTPEQARRAAAEGADVCGVGPMFATSTKDAGPLAGPGYLHEYLADPQASRVPHLAIGGITVARARELAVMGCRGIAVSSAVCSAPDPAEACLELVRAMMPAS